MKAKDESEKKAEKESLTTKEKIVEVALDVFAEDGLSGATMAEIAKRAGVTASALYRHFENKEQIFEAVVEKHSSAFSALGTVRGLLPELKPETALGFFLQGMSLYFETENEFMRVLFGESMRNPDIAEFFYGQMLKPANDFIHRLLELLVENGLASEDTDLDVASMGLLGMLGFYLLAQSILGSPQLKGKKFENAAEQLSSLFLNGVLKRSNGT